MIGERNPYVGPRSFGPADAGLFFGREAEARDLARLAAIEQVTILCGASGVGKTSLIHACLIPQLQEEKDLVVLPVARVSGELPAGVEQADNIFAFNLLLSIDADGNPARLAHVTLSDFLAHLVFKDGKHWTYDPAAGLAPPQAEGKSLSGTSAQPFVLIIDQFEEIITSHPARWQEQEDFFRQLNQALMDSPNLGVVLTLREDYVTSLDPYAPLMTDRLRARFYVERMGVSAALDAIRKPAELVGRPFADGVAEQLVDNLRQVHVPGHEGTVPGRYVELAQLQMTCYQLWENTKHRPLALITATDLREAGDIDRALTQSYEKTLAAALTDPAAAGVSERQLRVWFDEELITYADTRRQVHQGDSETAGLPNGVVWALQRYFLVREEARGGDTWIELAHDRFVDPIRASNRAWFARNLNSLTLAAQAWWEAGKPESKLYGGSQLAAAAAQLQASPAEFGKAERAFVEEGQKIDTRRAARRQRAIVSNAAALSLVFIALAAWAWLSRGQAQVEARKAATAEAEAMVQFQEARTARDTAIAAQQGETMARNQADANAATAVIAKETAEAANTESVAALAGAQAANTAQVKAMNDLAVALQTSLTAQAAAPQLLRDDARALANKGDIPGAIAKFQEALAFDPSLASNPGAAPYWHALCWSGATWNQAALVLDACETAVRLAPDDGAIRDSRGLARALTGNVQGAIADFEFAVAWAQKTGYDSDFVTSRQAWIDALKAGQNPFDEATLEALQ